MDSKDEPHKHPDAPPQQQLGDTPIAPWEMPTSEEKAKAEPVREALQKAVENVDTPEKAEQVAEHLERLAGDRTIGDVEQAEKARQEAAGVDAVHEAALAVKQAAKDAPPEQIASAVIAETAQKIAGAEGREREALAQAAQEVLNPEQQGAVAGARQRNLLRQAFIKRMRPYDALDAQIYLAVNHLPHNRYLNGFFYTLTFIYRGGAAWFGLLGLLVLLNPRRGWPVARQVAVPLALATSTVEYPVKTFFRRRRPFISLIQAVVIGKKPSSWSFPSGHSAAAFGGAYLLSRHFPRLRRLFYLTAGLVAFSRIYLGDHYPGDVLSGSLSGIALAKGATAVQAAFDKTHKNGKQH